MHEDDGIRSMQLIANLRSGERDPGTLNVEERQAVVAALVVQGVSRAEIANVVDVSDRTVRRDLQAIREGYFTVGGAEQLRESIGELKLSAETACGQLLRIGRDSSATNQERIGALTAYYKICDQFMQRMQSLGILPSAPTLIHALHEHRESGDEMIQELQRIQTIVGNDGSTVFPFEKEILEIVSEATRGNGQTKEKDNDT